MVVLVGFVPQWCSSGDLVWGRNQQLASLKTFFCQNRKGIFKGKSPASDQGRLYRLYPFCWILIGQHSSKTLSHSITWWFRTGFPQWSMIISKYWVRWSPRIINRVIAVEATAQLRFNAQSDFFHMFPTKLSVPSVFPCSPIIYIHPNWNSLVDYIPVYPLQTPKFVLNAPMRYTQIGWTILWSCVNHITVISLFEIRCFTKKNRLEFAWLPKAGRSISAIQVLIPGGQSLNAPRGSCHGFHPQKTWPW